MIEPATIAFLVNAAITLVSGAATANRASRKRRKLIGQLASLDFAVRETPSGTSFVVPCGLTGVQPILFNHDIGDGTPLSAGGLGRLAELPDGGGHFAIAMGEYIIGLGEIEELVDVHFNGKSLKKDTTFQKYARFILERPGTASATAVAFSSSARRANGIAGTGNNRTISTDIAEGLSHATGLWWQAAPDPHYTAELPLPYIYMKGIKIPDLAKTGNVYSLSSAKTFTKSWMRHLANYLLNDEYGPPNVATKHINLKSFYDAEQRNDVILGMGNTVSSTTVPDEIRDILAIDDLDRLGGENGYTYRELYDHQGIGGNSVYSDQAVFHQDADSLNRFEWHGNIDSGEDYFEVLDDFLANVPQAILYENQDGELELDLADWTTPAANQVVGTIEGAAVEIIETVEETKPNIAIAHFSDIDKDLAESVLEFPSRGSAMHNSLLALDNGVDSPIDIYLPGVRSIQHVKANAATTLLLKRRKLYKVRSTLRDMKYTEGDVIRVKKEETGVDAIARIEGKTLLSNRVEYRCRFFQETDFALITNDAEAIPSPLTLDDSLSAPTNVAATYESSTGFAYVTFDYDDSANVDSYELGHKLGTDIDSTTLDWTIVGRISSDQRKRFQYTAPEGETRNEFAIRALGVRGSGYSEWTTATELTVENIIPRIDLTTVPIVKNFVGDCPPADEYQAQREWWRPTATAVERWKGTGLPWDQDLGTDRVADTADGVNGIIWKKENVVLTYQSANNNFRVDPRERLPDDLAKTSPQIWLNFFEYTKVNGRTVLDFSADGTGRISGVTNVKDEYADDLFIGMVFPDDSTFYVDFSADATDPHIVNKVNSYLEGQSANVTLKQLVLGRTDLRCSDPLNPWTPQPSLAASAVSYLEVTIYQTVARGAAVPAAPANAMYSFADNTLRNAGSWSLVPSTPTDSQVVYARIATARSNLTGGLTWSAASVWTAGLELDVIYQRADTKPTKPANSTTQVPSGWSATIAGTTGTDTLWLLNQSRVGSSATWSRGDVLQGEGVDGTDGTDGEDGAAGVSFLEVIIYQAVNRGTSAPAAPANATYNFTNNTLTNGGSWSLTPPQAYGSFQVVYARIATARSDSTAALSWSRTFQWAVGLEIDVIYRRSATKPPKPADSGSLHPAGWSGTVAGTTGTDTLWLVNQQRTATSSVWNRGDVLQASAEDGEDGTDGVSFIEAVIYKAATRGATVPAAPATSSYNFTTNVITVSDSWSSTPPNPASNQIIYARIATFRSDSTAAVTWSTARTWAAGTELDQIFIRNATKPTKPANSTTAVPTNWSSSVAGTTGTAKLWVINQHRVGGSTTWIRGEVLESGADGQDGEDGVSFFEVVIYRVANKGVAAPAAPTNAKYNFTNNTLTNGGSWSLAPPSASTFQVTWARIGTARSDSTAAISWSVARPWQIGSELDIIYQRSATAPAQPANSSTKVPSGWFATVNLATGTDPLWLVNQFRVGSTSNVWTRGGVLRASGVAGPDGADGTTYITERIWAAYPFSDLPTGSMPSDAWTYEQVREGNSISRGNITAGTNATWRRSLAGGTLGHSAPYGFLATRNVPADATRGDAVSDTWVVTLATHYGVAETGGVRVIYEYRNLLLSNTSLPVEGVQFYRGGTLGTATSGTAINTWRDITRAYSGTDPLRIIYLEIHKDGSYPVPGTSRFVPSVELDDLAAGNTFVFLWVRINQWFVATILEINRLASVYRLRISTENQIINSEAAAALTNNEAYRIFLDIPPRDRAGPYLGVETYQGDYSNNAANEGLPGYFDFFAGTATTPTGLLSNITRLAIDESDSGGNMNTNLAETEVGHYILMDVRESSVWAAWEVTSVEEDDGTYQFGLKLYSFNRTAESPWSVYEDIPVYADVDFFTTAKGVELPSTFDLFLNPIADQTAGSTSVTYSMILSGTVLQEVGGGIISGSNRLSLNIHALALKEDGTAAFALFPANDPANRNTAPNGWEITNPVTGTQTVNGLPATGTITIPSTVPEQYNIVLVAIGRKNLLTREDREAFLVPANGTPSTYSRLVAPRLNPGNAFVMVLSPILDTGVTNWTLRYRAEGTGDNWTVVSGLAAMMSHTVSSLANDSPYEFQVRQPGGTGATPVPSEWSPSSTVTPSETTTLIVNIQNVHTGLGSNQVSQSGRLANLTALIHGTATGDITYEWSVDIGSIRRSNTATPTYVTNVSRGVYKTTITLRATRGGQTGTATLELSIVRGIRYMNVEFGFTGETARTKAVSPGDTVNFTARAQGVNPEPHPPITFNPTKWGLRRRVNGVWTGVPGQPEKRPTQPIPAAPAWLSQSWSWTLPARLDWSMLEMDVFISGTRLGITGRESGSTDAGFLTMVNEGSLEVKFVPFSQYAAGLPAIPLRTNVTGSLVSQPLTFLFEIQGGPGTLQNANSRNVTYTPPVSISSTQRVFIRATVTALGVSATDVLSFNVRNPFGSQQGYTLGGSIDGPDTLVEGTTGRYTASLTGNADGTPTYAWRGTNIENIRSALPGTALVNSPSVNVDAAIGQTSATVSGTVTRNDVNAALTSKQVTITASSEFLVSITGANSRNAGTAGTYRAILNAVATAAGATYEWSWEWDSAFSGETAPQIVNSTSANPTIYFPVLSAAKTGRLKLTATSRTDTSVSDSASLAISVGKTTGVSVSLTGATTAFEGDSNAYSMSVSGLGSGAATRYGTVAYAWTDDSTAAGTFSASSAASTNWSAATAGTYVLTGTVTINGVSFSATRTVTVSARTLTASISGRTTAQSGTSTVNRYRVDVGGNALGTRSYTYSVAWKAGSSGTLPTLSNAGPTSTSSVDITFPPRSSEATIVLTATVTRGGKTASDTQEIAIRPFVFNIQTPADVGSFSTLGLATNYSSRLATQPTIDSTERNSRNLRYSWTLSLSSGTLEVRPRSQANWQSDTTNVAGYVSPVSGASSWMYFRISNSSVGATLAVSVTITLTTSAGATVSQTKSTTLTVVRTRSG